MHGGKGNDVFHGSAGEDAYFGDAGNDLFIFGADSGGGSVDGGAGGKWTDVIEMDLGGGPASSLDNGGWVLEIDGNQVVSDSAHGSLELDPGSHGSITLDNGETIDFENIDKITW